MKSEVEFSTHPLLGPLNGLGAQVPATNPGYFDDVLRRVALTVNSSLEIRQVLDQVANLTLEAIPADRCSIFLLDESGTQLLPATSTGRRPNRELWERFRAMPPIDLREVPAGLSLFRDGQAIEIPDTAASLIVPPEFVHVFATRAALLAPLIAGGHPEGLLCLDLMDSNRDFAEIDRAKIEAIAGFASMAVRNARLYQGLSIKARMLERLFQIAGVLNSSRSLPQVLDFICQSYEELLGTTHCSVNLIEHEKRGIRTLAVRGVSWFIKSPRTIEAIPEPEIERVRKRWEESPEPVVYRKLAEQDLLDRDLIPESVGSSALFPLSHANGLVGFVVAGFPDPAGPLTEAIEAGQALAEQAATAVVRTQLDEALQLRLHEVEVLYRLSDVVAGTSDMPSALRQLNTMLEAEAGIRIESISLAESHLRRALSAEPAGPEEKRAIRSWRAKLGQALPIQSQKTPRGVLVPIAHRKKILGTVLLSPSGRKPVDEQLLMTIGSACAEVVRKAGLHRELAESERRLAIAAERERIGRDLHDSVGQILIGVGLTVATLLPEITDPDVRSGANRILEMAARGNREIRDAIHELLFLEVRRKGLSRSLRELTRRFEATGGLDVKFEAKGAVHRLASEHEDALFRAAHEALMNVERHSDSTAASVRLEYSEDGARVIVSDDGIGFRRQNPFDSGHLHFGLKGIRELVTAAGGNLLATNIQPKGAKVEAWFPATTAARPEG